MTSSFLASSGSKFRVDLRCGFRFSIFKLQICLFEFYRFSICLLTALVLQLTTDFSDSCINCNQFLFRFSIWFSIFDCNFFYWIFLWNGQLLLAAAWDLGEKSNILPESMSEIEIMHLCILLNRHKILLVNSLSCKLSETHTLN